MTGDKTEVQKGYGIFPRSTNNRFYKQYDQKVYEPLSTTTVFPNLKLQMRITNECGFCPGGQT